jgi:hypothetical protein
MKNAKYLEKDIAATLAKGGRISYHQKAIGTRWARIKRMLQRVQDQMLDDELTDWHEGDVTTLSHCPYSTFRPNSYRMACYARPSRRQTQISRKWQIVAGQIRVLKVCFVFADACLVHD